MVGDETEVTADNVGEILGLEGTDWTYISMAFSVDKIFDSNHYFDTIDGGKTYNKYNNSEGLKELERIDDAAFHHMGDMWKIPTTEDVKRLILHTSWTFIDTDGNEHSDTNFLEESNLKGVLFRANNGNSIFIPSSGWITP